MMMGTRYSVARWLLLTFAGLLGLGSIVLTYGFGEGPTILRCGRIASYVSVLLFLTEQVLTGFHLGSFRRYLSQWWPTFALSMLLFLETLGLVIGGNSPWLQDHLKQWHARDLTHAYLIVLQFYIVGVFAVQLPYMQQRFARWRVRPALVFVLVFLLLIALGTGLLLLPRATPSGRSISPLDALFTSTSAVCVTGLAVRDTGTEFTRFGHGVILALIQLGGLGIMSLTAALSLLLGRGIGVRENSLLREVFQIPMMAEVGRMVRFIITLTLGIEFLGAMILYHGADPETGMGTRLFGAVFHSVSAFCNAGFSLHSDSLIGQAENPWVMGTASGLLILGGLGFGVFLQVGAWLRGRFLRRGLQRIRLDLHARIVLKVSGGLLLLGGLLVAVLEWDQALAGLPWHWKLSQAFFQSATCRTAGFNSIDLNLLSPATLFLMVVLMFIGGAPGSTAGGVKVTALAIVWANLRSIGAGLSRVRLGRWEIEPVQLSRSFLVLSSGLVVAAVAVFVLLISERVEILTIIFEVFSALGTVGLSLGLTAKLSVVGKVLIIMLMFMGRLGPLTLAASLVGHSAEPRVRFPKGRILIG